MKKLLLLSTAAAVAIPGASFAQSTGTIETEKDTIVVTGTRQAKDTSGVVIQDSTKAKGLITQEYLAKQNPGQSVLNSINYIPGVNFTQNDPYGSSGGSLRIRGFDGNRISLTFDGAQLNDSGNYAIYSNQQLDPELIEQVNVNLGATDVDSPTASAAGGTVNYRSLIPTTTAGFRTTGSIGTDGFVRGFGLVNFGEVTTFGTRAWLSFSRATYDHWRGNGTIGKWQFNGRAYQPMGGGDFISIAGHYNRNRNNNYNNPNLFDLRSMLGTTAFPATYPGKPLEVGDYSKSEWKKINDLAFLSLSECLTSTGTVVARPTPGPGAQVDPTTCFTPGGPLASQSTTNLLTLQINPSNTGNVRGQSRWTLSDQLVLTVDPTYQYVLADGGTQSTAFRESDPLLIQGRPATGMDLNGDGDTLDTLLVGRPSVTNTNRITVLSSLVYKPAPDHTLRLAYTYDRAHHRQTGEYTRTSSQFAVGNPFFGRDGEPIITAAGTELQNRDRTSIALLNQIAGQYVGRFFDNRLRLEVGMRVPFFQRDLDQNCYTPAAGGGFPVCVQPEAVTATPRNGFYLVPDDYVAPPAGLLGTPVYAPFTRTVKYSKLLPNIGATYSITDSLSAFASYAKGFSAPRTDSLYRTPTIDVTPESTDSFDLGLRFINAMVQAQATLWKIDYSNRIVTSFDPLTNIAIDRNVGKVKSWGFDGSVGVSPIPQISILGLLSYTNAKLQDDVIVGGVNYVPVMIPATATSNQINATTAPPAAVGETYYCPGLPASLPTASGVYVYNVCADTSGKFVVETPEWQFGGRIELDLKPVTLGIQAKRVGKRFATDVNDVVVKGYTVVDLDGRVGLPFIPGNRTYLQVNVNNLLNERYFGNLSTTINAYGRGSSAPRFTPVSGRSVLATINVGM